MDIRPARGFSLIEIAVVMFIMTLLLGSILVPLNTRITARQISETNKMLAEINEALVGYAAINGYLPCPDKTTVAGTGAANDGQEDQTAGGCVAYAGNLPSAELGVGMWDSWGNRFKYVVLPGFAKGGGLTLNSNATLKICPFAGCSETQVLNLPFDAAAPENINNRAAAVVVSHGPNGLGAINAQTSIANPMPSSADELANLGTNSFVSRTMTDINTGAGEFDDIVIWIGKPILFKTMVAAGRLP